MEIAYQIEHPIKMNVQLQVRGLTALLGSSGSGKTTLLKALAGLIPAKGRPFAKLPAERRRVGYLPQGHALVPHLTVAENASLAISGNDDDVHHSLEKVGLTHLAHRYPPELSEGQRQRVALARALAANPRLLLLDEPTSALDSVTRDATLDLLESLSKKFELPMLIVTHDPYVASRCDYIGVLESGRIVQFDSPENVFQRPATTSIAKMVGFDNIFEGVAETADATGVLIKTNEQRLWVETPNPPASGSSVKWGIRPEEVMVVRPSRPLPPGLANNVFSVKITRVQKRGTSYCIHLDGPLQLSMLLPRHVQDRLQLREAASVDVVLKPRYIHLFSSLD